MCPRPAIEMIIFEHPRFGAPVAELVDESATALVAHIDVALHPRGYGPGAWSDSGRASGTRLAANRKALLLHLLDEQVDGRFDDFREIARWKPVTHQILRLAEL